jgi:HK97 family phage major capsid protein
MDNEKDAIGRPMLTENIAAPGVKYFNSLPIKVFPDAILKNISSGRSPVFYGSLEAGAYFISFEQLQFAVSEHVFFKKNQTAMRVITGYDVLQADIEAYMYCSFAAADPVVVNTKASA